MIDNNTTRVAVLSALRKAGNVIGVGDVHGWPRPQAYTDSLAMLNAARAAATAVPTLPQAPDKPKDIPKWVDAAVAIRQREAARRNVTDELLETWERNTARAGLAAATDYTSRLIDVFDQLVQQFDACADAPRALSGHETPDEIAAHTSALRAASDLTAAVVERSLIADAAQEAEDIGPDPIWLILEPVGTATRDQVQDALASYRLRIPQSLDEWDALRPLGLRLAHLGEVATRRDRHSAFMYQVAMGSADMGSLDHCYGEIDDTLGAPYGQRRQAETDMMFDRAQPTSL